MKVLFVLMSFSELQLNVDKNKDKKGRKEWEADYDWSLCVTDGWQTSVVWLLMFIGADAVAYCMYCILIQLPFSNKR